MKKFVPILQWMVNISLFLAIAGGGMFVYFRNNGDRLVEEQILKRFDQAAPDLKLVVGSTELLGTRGVVLNDLEVRERSTDKPLFRSNELIVEIDSNRLVEHQQVIVQSIRLKGADVLVARDHSGHWNWQKYQYQKPESSRTLPHVQIEDLRIRLILEHSQGIPPAALSLRCPHIQAVPASQHSYDIDGGVTLPGIGELKLAGGSDFRTKKWNLGGRLQDVRANQDLMKVAKATSPELEKQLTKIDVALETLLPRPQTASIARSSSALVIGSDVATAPQFSGLLDVNFQIDSGQEGIPDFILHVVVKEGRLTSPHLPVALTDVNAVFYKDNDSLIARLHNASGMGTNVRGEFQSAANEQVQPGQGWLEVNRFPVNSKLAPLLPEKTRRLFRAFEPDCVVSGRVELHQQPDGKWRPENLRADVSEGSVRYHRFRYPTSGISGTIRQRPFSAAAATSTEPAHTDQDVLLDVNLSGIAGGQTVTTKGWMKNPGATSENLFVVHATDFPIDSEFRNALEKKSQKVIDSLNLSGLADLQLTFYRPPGLDMPTHPFFDVRVHDARMSFSRFPYAIEQLSGRIGYDGATRHWTFNDLKGVHDNGVITAVGDFRGDASPGVLDLTVRARNAALDSDLYNALSSSQQTLWNMVRPSGFCNLTAKIDWTAAPGRPANVRFPASEPVQIFNTRIRPKPFPYDMRVSEAVLSFDPNDARFAGVQHCEIHSFKAMHDASPITAAGWAELKTDGEWQVHLNDVTARDLQPDNHLKAALPSSWRSTLSRLYHAGTVTISDSEMDFRGTIAGDANTTARWNLNMEFESCAMNAGLDLQDIYGKITALGQWDGLELTNHGEINLETAEVLEMPFTNIRGPYFMNNVELVLGARQVFEGRQLSLINRDGRMKAQAYGGELFVDALVDMREVGRYWFFTELANARLESYAQHHIPDQKNLRGVVNAWMSLRGEGDDAENVEGEGQMRISPAALYELPVVVKLLGALSQLHLNVQDRTAFNHVMMDFTVRDKAFQMSLIDMVGQSISFRGKGNVGFSGAVNLDFYSRPPRASLASLPILNNFLTNWAKVEVRGTTAQPQTRLRSNAKLDQGLSQFLQPFNPNPNGPAPLLTVPQMFQSPAQSQNGTLPRRADNRIGRSRE